jgi:hypothetical protein
MSNVEFAKAKKLAAVIDRQPTKRYLSYLRSKQWEQTKNEHLFRCDYICEICKRRRAIQVHHWNYHRLGYELPQDLCAVCVWCHHDIHCNVYPLPSNDNESQGSLPLAG